jgi:hypothetical protein
VEQYWLRLTFAAVLALFACSLVVADDGTFRTPQLLLTPQRLRRLQRDRQRQTVRWTNLENRVQAVPESPERGFELALFYAVTHDAQRGREAVEWALKHRCVRRQVAIVLDWCGDLLSEEQRQQLSAPACEAASLNRAESVRDAFFAAVSRDKEPGTDQWKDLLSWLQTGNFDAPALYAVSEYLSAVRSMLHADLREDARQFFAGLPTEFLLSLKPAEVEHPNWMTHIAALALVNVDPNLEGSQYLQAWGIEDRQMLRDGPGVAYEFLWANPYLPGVGYQNLDPWAYDSGGRLFARTDWNPDACWIGISTHGVEEESCPAGWQKNAKSFGRMTLIPVVAPCTELPRRRMDETLILWKLPPNQTVFYLSEGRSGTDPGPSSAQADPAGLWRAASNIAGKVCTSPDTLKVPPAHPSTRKR